jgi:hypothetical protein
MAEPPTHLRFTEDFEREWLAVDEAEQERCIWDARQIARSNNSIDLDPASLVWALRVAMAELERLRDPMPRKADDPKSPEVGPWFVAGYDGECDECSAEVSAGVDDIRRVPSGWQGRECCGDTERIGEYRRDPFVGTSTDEMGY